jgi:hypothetical protein
MPAQYLDEFIRELQRDGEKAFREHHGEPVLIVTRAAGEVAEKDSGPETTVMADTSGWRIQQVSLLNRVFAVSRGPFATARPILLGRTESADISIPDDSVSKKHCLFEVKADGLTVMDCGSTNGTSVDEAELAPNQPFALKGGETLKTGHFSFLYHTADGFVGYLKTVAKP